jgi:FkbM family methyltransferase
MTTAESNTLVSYAQNREDIVLYSFFRRLSKPGFYVDVGAYHPDNESVTRFFYERGWRGINIDANEELIGEFKKRRPEDVNLGVGVSDREGSLAFRIYDSHGLSTLSSDMKTAYTKEGEKQTGKHKDIKVNVTTLKKIFKEHKVREINFLKVDVEGAEYEVLKGNDWNKYRPEVICIEANHITRDWRPFLVGKGYTKAFFDGLNEYYVADEHAELADNFSYVDTFLLDHRVINVATQQLEKKLAKANLEAQKQQAKVTQLLHKLKAQEKEITRQQLKASKLELLSDRLRAELESQKALKHQLKSVYRSVDDMVVRSINRRGYAAKTKKAKYLKANLDNLSKEELMRMAWVWDAESYFQYAASGKGMKLRYRIAGGIYVMTRNAAAKSAKTSYRIAKRRRK